MNFKDYLQKEKDHLHAQITKELHNGLFGPEHRHVVKIKDCNKKSYVLTEYHVDSHQVIQLNIEGLKEGDSIYEIFECDELSIDNIVISKNKFIFTVKKQALEQLSKLK